MLPWLAVTLLEHLIVGVPLIVFIGIIALYLAAQVNLVAVLQTKVCNKLLYRRTMNLKIEHTASTRRLDE